jgi:hypothetical protein
MPDAVDTVVCPPDDGWWYHPKLVKQFPDKINCVTLHHSLTNSQALQPMQGLGRLKKSSPTISILDLNPPISESQPPCIPHHSIHPFEVWPSSMHGPVNVKYSYTCLKTKRGERYVDLVSVNVTYYKIVRRFETWISL